MSRPRLKFNEERAPAPPPCIKHDSTHTSSQSVYSFLSPLLLSFLSCLHLLSPFLFLPPFHKPPFLPFNVPQISPVSFIFVEPVQIANRSYCVCTIILFVFFSFYSPCSFASPSLSPSQLAPRQSLRLSTFDSAAVILVSISYVSRATLSFPLSSSLSLSRH